MSVERRPHKAQTSGSDHAVRSLLSVQRWGDAAGDALCLQVQLTRGRESLALRKSCTCASGVCTTVANEAHHTSPTPGTPGGHIHSPQILHSKTLALPRRHGAHIKSHIYANRSRGIHTRSPSLLGVISPGLCIVLRCTRLGHIQGPTLAPCTPRRHAQPPVGFSITIPQLSHLTCRQPCLSPALLRKGPPSRSTTPWKRSMTSGAP